MGLFSVDISFQDECMPDFPAIQTKFLEQTGLHLTYTWVLTTEKDIKRYNLMFDELERIAPSAEIKREYHNVSGTFSVEGFNNIIFYLFDDRINIEYALGQKYFPYAILRVVEELGMKGQFKIPARYKIKWSERKWYHRLKP